MSSTSMQHQSTSKQFICLISQYINFALSPNGYNPEQNFVQTPSPGSLRLGAVEEEGHVYPRWF